MCSLPIHGTVHACALCVRFDSCSRVYKLRRFILHVYHTIPHFRRKGGFVDETTGSSSPDSNDGDDSLFANRGRGPISRLRCKAAIQKNMQDHYARPHSLRETSLTPPGCSPSHNIIDSPLLLPSYQVSKGFFKWGRKVQLLRW